MTVLDKLTRNAVWAAMCPGYPDTRILEATVAAKRVLKDRDFVGIMRGKDAWYFYETYGLPLDLIIEIATERGYMVDASALHIHVNFPMWKDCLCCDYPKTKRVND